ncbi:MAG: zinc transporter ZntB, partial [Gammaproteobacteria bacterium]|nr:zinc transporter ZntB [Gammaproteobacteria bacterium]
SALMSDDPRPRSAVMQNGLLVILRGVNMNPGAEPEDMVSIRLWINDKRIVSTRRRKLLSVSDLTHAINTGIGPTSTGDFLVHLAARLVERMSYVVDEIDGNADLLEEKVLTLQSHQLRPQISQLRREAISLRRYLAPQRDAMTRLYNEKVQWLDETQRMQLREIADRTMRYIEDLDSVKERVIVIQEELMSRISEQMDKRMYVLSMVAAIFLPLGFLTGLLGINVGGIPGAEYKEAFLVFSGILTTVVLIQIFIFKKLKWM